MTAILALDTALGACSVALVSDDDGNCRVVAARCEVRARGHAEALAPMISDVMAEAGCAFRDVDAFGVTVGPGTFTGQRVGLAMVRGMALAAQKPVHAMTTLEAIASNVTCNGDPAHRDAIAVAIDARRGEVYFQLFGPGLEAVTAPLLVPADAVGDLLPDGTVTLAGTGAAIMAERAGAAVDVTMADASPQPDARIFALRMLGATPPDGPPEPLYLRRPDAKLPGKPVIARTF